MIENEIQNILLTITEFNNKVFMLNAPKLTQSPYCVCTMNRSEEEYILDGVTENRTVNFDINIYDKNVNNLMTIKYKVKQKLLSLLGTTQGAFYIQNVKVSMRDFYDSMVDLNRSVIELEIYI